MVSGLSSWGKSSCPNRGVNTWKQTVNQVYIAYNRNTMLRYQFKSTCNHAPRIQAAIMYSYTHGSLFKMHSYLSGKSTRTCVPPIECSVLWTECVTTALTPSCISACGECTKNDVLPFGDDSRHSCPSHATGVYMKAIEFVNRPSYNACKQQFMQCIALQLPCNWSLSIIMYITCICYQRIFWDTINDKLKRHSSRSTTIHNAIN